MRTRGIPARGGPTPARMGLCVCFAIKPLFAEGREGEAKFADYFTANITYIHATPLNDVNATPFFRES